MRINIAGAGAGKTTSMAVHIAECKVPKGKKIFCIAFTHAAVGNIEEKIRKRYRGTVPDYIRINTIHSFLYQELINPYYFLLFNRHFNAISTIELPLDYRFRNYTLRQLDTEGMLHWSIIPEKAKWVAYQWSGDNNKTRMIRKTILTWFADYCFKIFVDEAQDIDENMQKTLEALESAGVEIELFGDPKQDVKGYHCFQKMIDSKDNIKDYLNICHRCPQTHLRLSNRLAVEQEKQIADADNLDGSVDVYYESDIADKQEFANQFDLVYIHKKNERYDTHSANHYTKHLASLEYAVIKAVREKTGKTLSETKIKCVSYYLAEQMLRESAQGRSANSIVSKWINRNYFDYEKTNYAKMCQIIDCSKYNGGNTIKVNSIESVKGLEANQCLFILTSELAPYFFGEKDDNNKIKNLLYVALTRSLDVLSILITIEVENKYSKDYITAFFEKVFNWKGY